MPSKIFNADGSISGGGKNYITFTAWGGGGGSGVSDEGEGGGGGGAQWSKTIKAPGSGTYEIEIGQGGAPGVDGGDTIIKRSGVEIFRVPGGKAGNGRLGGAGGDISVGGDGGFGTPGNDGGAGADSEGEDAGGGGGGGAPPATPYMILFPGLLFPPPSFMHGDPNDGAQGGDGGGYAGDSAAFGGDGGDDGEPGEDGQGPGAGGGGGGKGADGGSGRDGRVVVSWDQKTGSDCCCYGAACITSDGGDDAIVLPKVIYANIFLSTPGSPWGDMIAALNPHRFITGDGPTFPGFLPTCCNWFTLDYPNDAGCNGNPIGNGWRLLGEAVSPTEDCVNSCVTVTREFLKAFVQADLHLALGANGGWRLAGRVGFTESALTYTTYGPGCEDLPEPDPPFCGGPGSGFSVTPYVYGWAWGEGTLSNPSWRYANEIEIEWGINNAMGQCDQFNDNTQPEDPIAESYTYDEYGICGLFEPDPPLYSYIIDDLRIEIVR